jgi:hypothetical protein
MQPGGTGRCQASGAVATACENVGEICVNENTQDTCCPSLICKRSIEGVMRCAQANGKACVWPTDACRASSDCCTVDAVEPTGHCLVNSTEPSLSGLSGRYYGVCSACGVTGRACKVDVDCCVDYECNRTTRSCEPRVPVN